MTAKTAKTTPTTTFQAGDKVRFETRFASGKGEIVAVRPTLKGDQYELKTSDGKTRCVRLSQIAHAK